MMLKTGGFIYLDDRDVRCVRLFEYGLFYKVTGDSVLIICYLFNIDIKNNRIFIPKKRINEIIYGLNKLNINYYIRNNKIIKRISKRNKRKIINKINNKNYMFYKNYLKYIK